MSTDGAYLCFFAPSPSLRRLTREKLDELHAQLSTNAATGNGGKKDKKKKLAGGAGAIAAGDSSGEEGAAATLRLLTSMARFHR